MRHFNAVLIFILVIISIEIEAQVASDSKLFQAIYSADSLLFEEGFNKCKLELVREIISDDIEFYHDINGQADKAMFMQGFEESLCSTPDRKPIRKMVEGSMEVFGLYNAGVLYGAIQNANHEFYIREPGKALYKTNVAKFTHLWILDGEDWKLSRSLSFDHQMPKADYGPKFEANCPETLFSSDVQIEELIAQHNIPSLGIGYIEKGKLQQVRVFGEKVEGQAVDYNTIYKVASLTKPVTAVVALKLVELGMWDLDESVSNYYIHPDLKNAPELTKLTTRHILSHQSGFPNWVYLSDTTKLTFEFEPGAKFQYSGEGYEYLRKALEAKFDKGLEVLADELLFEPLGMNNTHFYWDGKFEEKDVALEHDENGQVIIYDQYKNANAAANILTTVQDYSVFMAHILAGAGLSEDLYKDFITSHSTKKNGIDWGLGCELLKDLDENGEFAIAHGGGDYGLKTLMIILPKSQKGLLIFTNSENGMVLWKKLVEEYLGDVGTEIVKRNLE